MNARDLKQLVRALGPVALSALRRGQLVRPACTLTPPDPDILAEYEVRVPISDGFDVTVNIFRSKTAAARDEPVPVVMCAHPYDNRLLPALGKTPLGGPPQQYRLLPQDGSPTFSTQTSWESPDPNFWVPAGYAVVNMNLPGYGSSGGPPSVFSEQQGKAYYEAIEWVAAQPWCDGNVGLNGVSFLAISQYHVAFCKAYGGPPPSLRAICPWEGVADSYQDLFRPGGVWEAGFPVFWWYTEVVPAMNAEIEQFIAQEGSITPQWRQQHPTRDEWVEAKVPALEQIEVPTLLCASFSDHGVHTPGGFKAFTKIGATDKWLYTHRWLKWDSYYSREVQELTRRFFDCFVKDQRDNGFLEQTPRVRLEIRSSRDEVVQVRDADAWPLPQTELQRWYLDAQAQSLGTEPPARAQEAKYAAGRGQAVFRYRFEHDMTIVGPMALHVWVEARPGSLRDALRPPPDDVLLAVAIDKRDRQGESVRFFGTVGSKHDMVTRGYAAASMREQTAASTEWLVELSMREHQPLKPGQVVKLAVEIYPHATHFAAGETLELLVAGHELIPSAPLRKDLSANRGIHVLHTGGERASYLVVPVLPD
ncbi:MAG: CocE/NonD family hydrolase [Myxococcota bacterium]